MSDDSGASVRALRSGAGSRVPAATEAGACLDGVRVEAAPVPQ